MRQLEEPGQASANFGDLGREIRLVEICYSESGIRRQVLTDSVKWSEGTRYLGCAKSVAFHEDLGQRTKEPMVRTLENQAAERYQPPLSAQPCRGVQLNRSEVRSPRDAGSKLGARRSIANDRRKHAPPQGHAWPALFLSRRRDSDGIRRVISQALVARGSGRGRQQRAGKYKQDAAARVARAHHNSPFQPPTCMGVIRGQNGSSIL